MYGVSHGEYDANVQSEYRREAFGATAESARRAEIADWEAEEEARQAHEEAWWARMLTRAESDL